MNVVSSMNTTLMPTSRASVTDVAASFKANNYLARDFEVPA